MATTTNPENGWLKPCAPSIVFNNLRGVISTDSALLLFGQVVPDDRREQVLRLLGFSKTRLIVSATRVIQTVPKSGHASPSRTSCPRHPELFIGSVSSNPPTELSVAVKGSYLYSARANSACLSDNVGIADTPFGINKQSKAAWAARYRTRSSLMRALQRRRLSLPLNRISLPGAVTRRESRRRFRAERGRGAKQSSPRRFDRRPRA
jgi:hypothetical protein